MTRQPLISFVLATYNRRNVTLNTLEQLQGASAPAVAQEIIAVDNQSTDGTAAAIDSAFPSVCLISAGKNLGSCAKALGVDQARGRYVVFLDDDSYPRPGSIERMIQHFEQQPALGAAGFRVHLPDGREECSAFPNVFVGCGVGFRADALRQVGGLDAGFFMQAEEYDLSFRLIQAGWQVRNFPDLHVEHLKTPCARRSGRTVYYDIRNNLTVAARYLPQGAYRPYFEDWLQRYGWLAVRENRRIPYLRGALAGTGRALRNRRTYARWRLSTEAFEALFHWEYVAKRMRSLRADGVRSVIFAGLGKNALAFHRAAELVGIHVSAIADDRFARPNRIYRNVPIEATCVALDRTADAIVVSDTSPIHAQTAAAVLAGQTPLPVHCWFGRSPTTSGPTAPAGIRSTTDPVTTDNTGGTQAAVAAR